MATYRQYGLSATGHQLKIATSRRSPSNALRDTSMPFWATAFLCMAALAGQQWARQKMSYAQFFLMKLNHLKKNVSRD